MFPQSLGNIPYAGDGVERAQHIEPLASARRLDEDAHPRAEVAQQGRKHEVRGIHKIEEVEEVGSQLNLSKLCKRNVARAANPN
jgi:hypothetical protein